MIQGMQLPLRFLMFGGVALVAAGLAVALLSQQAWAEGGSGKEAHNKALIRQSFEAWAAGTGGPFELLAEDADWTIVGRSAVAKTYPTREAFMSEVIRPFNARMREPLQPQVREIYADGDVVIVLFDAASVAQDGEPYRNTYTWYLRLRDGRIVSAIAFFDSIAFDEMWTRVAPAQ